MRNRAKCKLCNSIIESYTIEDRVECECGEIGISGGLQNLECFANDFSNFLRVDDEGNEIVVKVKENDESVDYTMKPSRAELVDMLEELRLRIDSLPPQAMHSPVTHADFASLLMLISAIFKSE